MSKPKRPLVPGDGDPRHGTASAYTNHRCRCVECRAAWAATCRALQRRRRAGRRAEQAATLAALIKDHGPLVTVREAQARTGVHIGRLDAACPPGLTRHQVGNGRYVVLADVYAAVLALQHRGVDVDGTALRDQRRQLGIKLVDVAHHVGVTESAVSRWENGLTRPRPDHARRWHELLDGTAR